MSTNTGTIAGTFTAKSGTVMEWKMYDTTFCGDTVRYLHVDYYNKNGVYTGMFRDGHPDMIKGFFKENDLTAPEAA